MEYGINEASKNQLTPKKPGEVSARTSEIIEVLEILLDDEDTSNNKSLKEKAKDFKKRIKEMEKGGEKNGAK